MRKRFSILFTILLFSAIAAIPAKAAQAFPKLPDVDVHAALPQSFWDKWFGDHPIVLPQPMESAQPTHPVETTAESTPLTELGVPTITEAHYTHSRAVYTPSNLKIAWTGVEGAERYEVLITLANGETVSYVETGTSVSDTNAQCPQSYSGENGHIAYVKVRAIAGDSYSEWSAEDTISCNALHFGS